MTAYAATIASARVRRRGKTRTPRVSGPVTVAAGDAPSRDEVAVATAAGLAGAVGLGVAALVALLLTTGAVGESGIDPAAPGAAAVASGAE
jgi:hypothetical protein